MPPGSWASAQFSSGLTPQASSSSCCCPLARRRRQGAAGLVRSSSPSQLLVIAQNVGCRQNTHTWYLIEAKWFEEKDWVLGEVHFVWERGRGGETALTAAAFTPALPVVFAVGEVADDSQRAQEDRVLSDVPHHCHHLCGLVLVRAHRPHC